MEKLQLMMFEVLNFKLKFSQKVIEQYFNTVTARFGSKSQIEQEMRAFVSDSQKQQEIISDPKHIAYDEFKLLAKMQLKYDIAKLQRWIKESPNSPFLTGYQIALKYMEEIGKEHKSFNLPLQVSEAEYNMLKAILGSQIDDENGIRQTSKGVDCPTICMVFRTMICFNDSLLANKFNYDEAKDTVKTIFKLCVKCAV